MSVHETPTAGPESPAPAPIRTGRLWALALTGAILAGLASFAAFEATPTIFIPPENMVSAMGRTVNQPKLVDRNAADRKNAMVAFGVAGATLALALGVAGGVARRSARGAVVGGLVGVVLGLAAGAGAATGLLPVFQKQHDADQTSVSKEMTLPLLIHAGLWAAVGASAGLALAIGAGAPRRLASVVLGGLVGGAMGGGIYEVLGALLWPSGQTYLPIALVWPPRLFAAMAGPLLATAVAVSGLLSGPRRPRKPAAATPEALA